MTTNYERAPTIGACLGEEWRGAVALVDTSAPVASGDTVRCTIDYADGSVSSVIKRLEVDSQDRWFICCNDGGNVSSKSVAVQITRWNGV